MNDERLLSVIETLAETVNGLKSTVSEMSEKMTKLEAKLPEDTEEPDDQQAEDLLDSILVENKQKTENNKEVEDPEDLLAEALLKSISVK